jgi:ubiquinone/menaquinone biosynthesis C-methylase UbiE
MPLRCRHHASCLTVALLLAAVATAQTPAPPSDINKPFQNPNVPEYVKKFEVDSREVYARRAEIVKAIRVVPGMVVADVGAGTGLFTRLFAERVGPTGKVYAVDISAPFLKHIAAESKQRGHLHVQVVQGSHDSINLPEQQADVVFLCDTYHHLEHPERVLASIHRALRPEGRLVIVELDRREGVSADFVLKHVRASKAQFLAEIAAAGFELTTTPEPPPLKENFFAELRKVERPGKAP